MVVLDGVRGVAIVMVLCVHFIGDAPAYTALGRAMVKLANYGIWGVDLFFVLSGFLITGLLYDSKKSAHYFRDFYVRRTLRIFPLYYAVLALLFIGLPALRTPYPPRWPSLRHQMWLWLYASNFYLAIQSRVGAPLRGALLVARGGGAILSSGRSSYCPLAVARCSAFCVAVTVPRSLCAARCLAGPAACRGDGPHAVSFRRAVRRGFLALTDAIRESRARRPAGALVPRTLLGLVLVVSLWNAVRGSLSDVVLPIRGTLIALTFGRCWPSLAAPARAG
jgi:hypothetical protein